MITVVKVPRRKYCRDDYRWETLPPLWAASVKQWVFVGVWEEWFDGEITTGNARNCPWAAAADAAKAAIRLLRTDDELLELMMEQEFAV